MNVVGDFRADECGVGALRGDAAEWLHAGSTGVASRGVSSNVLLALLATLARTKVLLDTLM